MTSVEDAVEAARGGAHRLEVVRDLDRGGLTPPIDLVRRIQRDVDLPLRVMVRESDGFACRSDGERRRLADAATALDGLGVDGLVVGWTRDDEIDEDTLACVLDAAPSSRATFHHAFDALPDPEAALRALARHPRIDRVLTRGLGTEARSAKVAGAGGLASRCATLTRYAGWAAPRVIVLPGGGLDGDGLRALVSCGCLTEAHVGRAARAGGTVDGRVSADAVRALRRAAGWETA